MKQECDFTDDISGLEDLMKRKAELVELDLEYLEKDKQRKIIFGQMEEFMQTYISKAYSKRFGIQTPTLRDILAQQIPQGMSLYNPDGFPIQIEK